MMANHQKVGLNLVAEAVKSVYLLLFLVAQLEVKSMHGVG